MKRNTAIRLAACAVAVALCGRLSVSGNPLAEAVKVGSYNIRQSHADKGPPNAWDERKADLVALVKRLDLDVCGLQEVNPSQFKYLREALDDYEIVGEHRNADRKSGEASPVFYRKSRFEAEKSGTFWLSETPDVPGSKGWGAGCPRVCTYLVLRDRKIGRRFCFANAHTDHKSEKAREQGMLLVVERMKEFGKGVPIVFTGDHNCRETEPPAKVMASILTNAVHSSETPPMGPWRTFNGWDWRETELLASDALKLSASERNAWQGSPDALKAKGKGYEMRNDWPRIDYIYVSPEVRVLAYETVGEARPGAKLYPSDHFPICATLAFPDAADGAEPAATELDEATVARGAALSRRAAAESMVLLKNEGGALPLAAGSKIALFDISGGYRAGGAGSSDVKAVRIVDVRSGLAEAGFALDRESRDTAVVVIARASGEGADNKEAAFDLSTEERETIGAIKAAGFKKIVVVCNSGHVLNLAPLESDPAVSAILWTWYPGGEGGAAVGDVLSGKVNPSGRLAATFARAVSDWPSDGGFLDYRGAVPYEDDIFVGYRYFETIPGAKEKVVYPFGFGLSYTTWKVEPISCAETSVQVRVTNTGSVAGKRSVLCYTSQKGGVAQHPALELRAFAKTRLLNPGESEELTLSFVTRDLAFFDEDGVSGHPGAWVLDKGDYTILVGGSVRDVVPAGTFTVAEPQVLETPGFKLKADLLARRLNADGTYTKRPVAYPTRPGKPGKGKIRKEPVENPTVTLYDVADGKATLDELIDQMTLREMLFLLFGHPKVDPCGTGSIGAFEKFGIPAAQTCDGPAGIRRSVTSTCFPCAALLASSFDPALMREVGEALGDEAAETDFDILLAPGLCIHRHPLCGRNFEYFGEDPLVSGVSAAEYVKGVQSKGVGATIKHFAGNDRETARKYEKDIVGERAFREIYLRGFERAVKEAKPWAVMSAYSGLNGYNCSEHHGLLTGILRDEWGFDGLVMTDWHTSVPLWREIAAGNDVKMPEDLGDTERVAAKEGFGVNQAVSAEGRLYLPLDAVRESVKRVCRMAMKTRRFERGRKQP